LTGLEGKVALITGAARGQGQAHAIAFAEKGADVIAIDIDPGAGTDSGVPAVLAETVREVERRGRRIVARLANVAVLSELQAAVTESVAILGRLDFVVVNAAIASISTPVFDHSEENWSRILDVNVKGAWATCKAASPFLDSGASIVLIGSTAALRPAPGYVAYNASKHALKGMMRAMVLELAPRGIRVNAVHPGVVDTPMFHNPGMYKLLTGDENASRETIAGLLRPGSPMGIPWVEARDVAAAVIFLCSDDARYITGADIPVDAGAAAK
jgi:(+)-trans-carveol dehydrogenase